MSHTPLSAVMLQFKAWRDNRKHKSRIPEELWAAAVSLSDRYSIHRISKALHLNHTALSDRISACKANSTQPTDPCFIELPAPQSPASECLVEMENRAGEKIRMHFSGAIGFDLLALSQNFWERRS